MRPRFIEIEVDDLEQFERVIDLLFECEEIKFPNVLAGEGQLEQASYGLLHAAACYAS